MNEFFKDFNICLSIGYSDWELVNQYLQEIDIVELRLDLNKSEMPLSRLAAIIKLIQCKNKLVISACRSVENGGSFKGSEEERLSILSNAISAGSNFIDAEFNSRAAQLINSNQDKTKFILSYHNFRSTPKELEKIFACMVNYNAEIYKVVTMIKSYRDNLAILNLNKHIADKYKKKCSCFGLGEKSSLSRVLLKRYGGSIQYIGIPGYETAKGQLTLADHRLLRLRTVDENTKIYGIVGEPLEHSLSYNFHNQIFKHYNDNAVFLKFPVDEITDFHYLMNIKLIQGLAVTFPWKDYKHWRQIAVGDEDVQSFGSGNTVYKKSGDFHLADTDSAAFRDFLESKVISIPESVVILGTGKMATKISKILREYNCNVWMVSRHPEKTKRINSDKAIKIISYSDINSIDKDIIINCTPFGLKGFGDIGKLFENVIYDSLIALDMNYNLNGLTPFLKKAKYSAEKMIDGLEIFLRQALKQQFYWTDKIITGSDLKKYLRDSM